MSRILHMVSDKHSHIGANKALFQTLHHLARCGSCGSFSTPLVISVMSIRCGTLPCF